MKCGNCKGRHDSVAAVRSCYAAAGKGGQGVTMRDAELLNDVANAATFTSEPRRAGKATRQQNANVRASIPAGRYAVLGLDASEPQRVRFFRVQDGKGKWKGWKFLAEQAGDDFHNVRDDARRNRIYAAIAEDPETAMLMYGQELGMCGHCGRTLTDEDSRARGIGPVCAGKVNF